MSERVVREMDLSRLHKVSETEWCLAAEGPMRVPAVLYGSESLIAEMDDKVLEQIVIIRCSCSISIDVDQCAPVGRSFILYAEFIGELRRERRV